MLEKRNNGLLKFNFGMLYFYGEMLDGRLFYEEVGSPIFIIFFAMVYIYQQNPMVTGQAIVHSVELLQKSSEEWGDSNPTLESELKALPTDYVEATLNTR
jgi:hypothetical protein